MSSIITHTIIADGTVLETSVGACFLDAVQSIWSGEYVPGDGLGWQVYAVTFEPGLISTSEDRTNVVALALCERTYVDRRTPEHVGRWLEWLGFAPFREMERAA